MNRMYLTVENALPPVTTVITDPSVLGIKYPITK